MFLLSPANMRGVRAGQLHRSRFEVSSSKVRTPSTHPSSNIELRTSNATAGSLSVEEAFTYTSSLYFRGKMAYARRFVAPPAACTDEGIYVIAPGFGLVPPHWTIDLVRFRTLQKVPAEPSLRSFRESLEAAAQALASRLQPDTTVVLLGSLAHGKYLDVLWPVFRDRLRVPQAFVGTGDMRRGALLLRAAVSGQELEYMRCSQLFESNVRGKRRRLLCP